jgi:hypothetical protein
MGGIGTAGVGTAMCGMSSSEVDSESESSNMSRILGLEW